MNCTESPKILTTDWQVILGEQAEHDGFEVADDEQRGVFEVFAIEQELIVRGVEVLVFAVVLPAEEPTFPHVGPPRLFAIFSG